MILLLFNEFFIKIIKIINIYNRKEKKWENIKFAMKINFMIIIVLNWKKIERNKKKQLVFIY